MNGKKFSRARDIEGFAGLVALADDDFLDEFELQTIKNLALEDGVIDEAEKRVLRGVFNRIRPRNTSPEVWDQLQKFRQKYDI